MTERPTSKSNLLLTILILAAAPYFLGLGASSLWDSNEAFYAETPRRMIESGDFVSPEFNNQPRFNKPPLSYWAVALSYKLFGVSEWSARLPVAAGAMVIIITAFLLGREVFSVEAGLFAAIALAISPRILMFSRRIIIDVYVAMFMSLTLLFFLLAEKYPNRRKLYLALMYVSAGLGVLTKGPVAIALPAIVFLIYLIASKNLGRLREMLLPAGALIIAAIVLPWYWEVYERYGWSYIETFILKDNLSRYTEPVWGPRRGIFFYLPVILGDMFPWSVFLITVLAVALKNRFLPPLRALFGKRTESESEVSSSKEPVWRVMLRGPDQSVSEGTKLSALLWIWIAVIVVFFSLSSNKEDLYILPIYTAAAALVGGLLAPIVTKSESAQSSVRWTTLLLSAILTLIGVSALYIFSRHSTAPALAGASMIGWALVAGGLIAAAQAVLRKIFISVIVTALTLVSINYVFVLKVLPDFERYKPVRAFCDVIKERGAPDALAGYYRLASPSMTFYLQRPIFEHYDPEGLQSIFFSGKEVYCLIKDEDYKAVREFLPTTYILASRPVFQVKLKSIFERVERPQVFLISNRNGVAVPQ